MTLDIIKVMLKELKNKIPSDKMFLYSYSQFKVGKATNPKLIFNNLGTYLLVPFSDVIEGLNFDNLFKEIMSSTIYLENKDEYEEFISNVVFKPLKLYSEEEKSSLMRNMNTMRQLYISYYKRRGIELPLNRRVMMSQSELKVSKSAMNEFLRGA